MGVDVKTYSMKEVLVVVGGRPISGWADGDSVSVEFDEDRWIKTVGSDGEVARSASNNRSGKFTFTLMYSSLANKIFADIVADDDNSLEGVVSVHVIENQSQSSFRAISAWPLKPPTNTFGREMGSTEWVFDCAELEVDQRGIPGQTSRQRVIR